MRASQGNADLFSLSPTVTDMTRDVLSHVVVRFSQAPTVHFLLPRMTSAVWVRLLMASLRSGACAQALKGLVDDQVVLL